MTPSPKRIAHRYLERQAAVATFMGIDNRSLNERAASWWVDLEKLIKEWWSLTKVDSRLTRGNLVVKVPSIGANIHIKGPPAKPTVYVGGAKKQFGPDDSLQTIMYWIDSITRP
jgi:hypothetical protein